MSAAEPVRVMSFADLEGESIPGAPALDADRIAREAPQETWAIRGASGRIDARGSIWWRALPPRGDRQPGYIGHYAARAAAAGGRLLDHLCDRLAAEECTEAIGPIDGSTWRAYRLVIERGAEPEFLFDLSHPADWPDHFRAAGFTVLAEYVSTVIDDLSRDDPRLARVSARMQALGVRIRTFAPERARDELRALHELSLVAFRHALLFSPIALSDFLDVYRPWLSAIDPRHILMAEHEGRLAGVVFSTPDLRERAAGRPRRTLVVKTLAVRPDRRYAGLGALLLSESHRIAREAGLARAIHALMHVSNESRALSGHWQGRPIRRYALFTRRLAP
jgi:L-amino acid N-acyltransferase YncA